jgi:hypothetical protein
VNWIKKQLPLCLFFVPVIVYILTASRTLVWGDGAEFYIAARTLGIPHPSGYPLFLLVSRLLYLISSSPFLSNFVPGIFTGLTALFLFLILVKLTRDRIVSIITPLFLCFGQAVWAQSVNAEIYTLNLFFAVFLIYLLLNSGVEKKYIPMIFFVSGLALANHLTALLYVIPVLVYTLLFKKRSFYFLALIIIPLTLYFYFPIRSRAEPLLDLFDPVDLERSIAYISGRAFHYRALFLSSAYILAQIKQFIIAWWRQFLILIPLGFYGIFLVTNKKIRYVLIIMSVCVFGYSLLYNIPDKQGYFLPVYGIWAIFTALALSRLVPKKIKPALFIFPLLNIILNYQVCDLSRESSLRDFCASIYQSTPDSSIIVSDDYFVYCGLLNQELDGHKNIVPCAQFYLRTDWYITQIKHRYPHIKISAEIDRLLKACDQELARARGLDYGEISKEYCLQIQRAIVDANIDSIPVYFFIYDDAAWPRSWFEFKLEDRGLVYRFYRDSVELHDYPLDLPAPAIYRVDKLINPDAIAVAKKFAAAYNRRGILRFQAKQTGPAIADFKKALEYYPEYAQVLSNLGLAYLDQADTLNTIKTWQTYLSITPATPQHKRIQAWYDYLAQQYRK